MDYQTIAGVQKLTSVRPSIKGKDIDTYGGPSTEAQAAEGSNDSNVGVSDKTISDLYIASVASSVVPGLGWLPSSVLGITAAIMEADKRALKVGFPSYDPNLYATVGDGDAAVKEVRDKVNDAYWDDWLTKSNGTADNAGHECGPGKFFKSKDQDTVDNLEQYTNTNNHTGVTDQLVYFSMKFYKNVVDPKQAFGTEYNRVADRLATVYADQGYIEAQQKEIVAKYKVIQEDLNLRIAVLQKILNDSESNKNMLKTYQNGANVNNNQTLNTTFNTYLDDRVGVAKDISVQNYEDLYSNIILQNDILQNTQDEMEYHLLKNDKKAEFTGHKRETMYTTYIRAVLAFYILLIIYVFYLIFYDNTWSFYVKLAIVCGLGIFPLAAPHIEMLLYNIWNYMMSILSGSVFEYKTLL